MNKQSCHPKIRMATLSYNIIFTFPLTNREQPHFIVFSGQQLICGNSQIFAQLGQQVDIGAGGIGFPQLKILLIGYSILPTKR